MGHLPWPQLGRGIRVPPSQSLCSSKGRSTARVYTLHDASSHCGVYLWGVSGASGMVHPPARNAAWYAELPRSCGLARAVQNFPCCGKDCQWGGCWKCSHSPFLYPRPFTVVEQARCCCCCCLVNSMPLLRRSLTT